MIDIILAPFEFGFMNRAFFVMFIISLPSAVLSCYLVLGNMLGIDINELFTAGLISLGVSLLLLAKRKDYLLTTFDPIQAQASGLSVTLLHYSLLAMISLTIVATLSAVGIILSIGLIIAPGSIAFLLTKRFELMILISVLVTWASSFIGLYISFFIDSAPAPTIILVLTSFFIIAFIRTSFTQSKTVEK